MTDLFINVWRSISIEDKRFTDTDTGAIFTRVQLKPLTGRGHQLRLHMKAIGLPILGDTIHGEGGIPLCSSRLCLHAQKLEVDWNGFRLEAESIPPFWFWHYMLEPGIRYDHVFACGDDDLDYQQPKQLATKVQL